MKRSRGFTLVEVVVAFLLLSLVLVTVFEIFTSGMSRSGELDNYSRALAIAQSELAVAGIEEPLAEGETRGETEDRQYRWTLTVAKHQDEAMAATAQLTQGGKPVTVSPYTLYRVDSRVAWTSPSGVERQVALSTLLLGQNK